MCMSLWGHCDWLFGGFLYQVRSGGDIMEMENELDRKLEELKAKQNPVEEHPKYKDLMMKIEELSQPGIFIIHQLQ